MYRIMIVEDDRGISESVAAQVRHWGFEALCADDFREAMAVRRLHCLSRSCTVKRGVLYALFNVKISSIFFRKNRKKVLTKRHDHAIIHKTRGEDMAE